MIRFALSVVAAALCISTASAQPITPYQYDCRVDSDLRDRTLTLRLDGRHCGLLIQAVGSRVHVFEAELARSTTCMYDTINQVPDTSRFISHAQADVDRIRVVGSSYADAIRIEGLDVEVSADLGDGADHLIVGQDAWPGGPVDVAAGAHNDCIMVRGGGTVRGQSGADTILAKGDAWFDLDGGDGADDIYGGSGDDIIRGGEGDDYIVGRAGDDTIYGQGGEDRLLGGLGDDHINGGGSGDVITDVAGANYIHGGSGSDTIVLKNDDGTSAPGTVVKGGRGEDTCSWVAQRSLDCEHYN